VQKRSRPRQKEEVGDHDLIPVLSCMFLLVPALLLAMEIASLAAITVSPPRFDSAPGRGPERPGMEFSVEVRSDGFLVERGRGGASEADGTTIAMKGTEHDFEALEAVAVRVKQQHSDETRVTVTAESSVEFDTIVRTIDALRGRDCSLADAGAEPPDECLFWDVVVEG
jgi:biopolymer transport protein ExbD